MKRSKTAESLARVHTHTHTLYVYGIGEQSGELYFREINIYRGYMAFIRDG